MTRTLILGLLLLSGRAVAQDAPRAADRPRLVVVVVIDQMRADFLNRFAGFYHGGFKRLRNEGAMFTEARHNHSGTETAPGHATLATGTFPARSGIVANDWYDRLEGRVVYSVSDTAVAILGRARDPGRSPRRLQAESLGDWLKRASPGSRVFSVALKDRAAILMGGKRPDGAYWYDGAGGFVTSSYYGTRLPAWLDSFNLREPRRYLSATWTRLLPVEGYFVSREDSFPTEHDGVHVTFPHSLDTTVTGSAARSWSELLYTPFGDELVLTLARELVVRERLGGDDQPDLLWISGSSGDYVGHRYGPLSQEIQDYYLRLDGWLGEFFAFLDRTVGADRYTVALSGDHGVLPLPEELARRGLPSRRVLREELNVVLSRAETELMRSLGVSDKLFAGFAEGIMLHYSAARAKGLSAEELQETVARKLRTLPLVADAYTATELRARDTPSRPFLEQFRNNYHEDRSADIMVRFQPMYYVPAYGPFGTSHGTAYDYDSHVPLVFFGAGTTPGVHDDRVSTVDLAPTLARLLGVRPTGTIDGEVLEGALR